MCNLHICIFALCVLGPIRASERQIHCLWAFVISKLISNCQHCVAGKLDFVWLRLSILNIIWPVESCKSGEGKEEGLIYGLRQGTDTRHG